MGKLVEKALFTAFVACCFSVMLVADDRTDCILAVTGAAAIEDLDEDTVERLSEILRKPLNINTDDVHRLKDAGLISAYQEASLDDYRLRHGDVMSVAELALVDGFGKARASALAPFISFGESSPLGTAAGSPSGTSYGRGRRSSRRAFDNDLTVKSAVRLPISFAEGSGAAAQSNRAEKDAHRRADYSYGLKYRVSNRRTVEAGIAVNKSYSDKSAVPSGGAFFVAVKPKRFPGKIVAGDYHLRYGQGLALWTGFSMSGFASPMSFCRRPSGISPCGSYSGYGSLRGVAADYRAGHFLLSGSVAVNGLRELMGGEEGVALSLLPALNVSWFARNAQVSFTCFARTVGLFAGQGRSSVSDGGRGGGNDGGQVGGQDGGGGWDRKLEELKCAADVRWCVRGVEVFAEGALDALRPSPAILAGVCAPAGDAASASLCLRYYPAAYRSDYSGAARASSRPSGEHGIAAAFEFSAGKSIALQGKSGFGSSVKRHNGAFSADAAMLENKNDANGKPSNIQLKLLCCYKLQISPSLSAAIRLNERLRKNGDKTRTDLRCDIAYSSGIWLAAMRAQLLHCRGTGLLSYIEGGCRHPRCNVYLRGGLFRIDDWNDRIYVYERDAPGSFNVPAYYGRGIWCAAVSGIRLTRHLRINLRASLIAYPERWQGGAAKNRRSSADFRIQIAFVQ